MHATFNDEGRSLAEASGRRHGYQIVKTSYCTIVPADKAVFANYDDSNKEVPIRYLLVPLLDVG